MVIVANYVNLSKKFVTIIDLQHICAQIKKQLNMKNSILTIFFACVLFASCKKEPCEFGHIEIHNVGTEMVTIYSIPSMPVLLPGETVIQSVPICTGFDVNGNECGDGIQTVISYKFTDGEKQNTGAMVHRCETVTVKIFN